MTDTASAIPPALPPVDVMRAAVADRDVAFDGRFIVAVTTTGVFCRPTCPARTPRVENMRFYPNAEAAQAAGFRACKRCRPTEAASDVEAMAALARYIDDHADDALPLAHLARRAGLSPARLQRRFTQAVGVSPKAYQNAARLRRLKAALKLGDEVTGAIFEAGYGSTSRVYGGASRKLGMTPGAYRDGGAGETIIYATRDTALGPLILAATLRGVCFVQFGASRTAMLTALHAEFPKAAIAEATRAADPQIDAWIDDIETLIAQGGPQPTLPLDLRGTAFQIRVWNYLLTLKPGEVVSYAQAAAAIGKPSAVRAVASACARNRVCLLVPCHRVLRSDGSLGGYRWGLDRKQALLDAEREAASTSA